MNGQLSPTEGRFTAPRQARISMLGQELPATGSKSVKEHVAVAFTENHRLREEAGQYYLLLENSAGLSEKDLMQATERLQQLEALLHVLEAHTEEERMMRILVGLGFTESQANTPMQTLSGGWQMRAELARLLLEEPDLLLLDEPSNHLDMESILWLEEFLKGSPAAVMLISHDRDFLDNTSHRTLELAGGQLHDYPFSYSRYLEARQERIAHLEAARKNQEKERRRLQENIDRFR